MNEKRLDHRRKYYLILDCETATLPCAQNYSEEQKKNICIAKPLIYDLGWTIIDKRGNVYRKRSFVISEIFSVPAIFNTGYYASKRPVYLQRLEAGETTLTDWRNAADILLADLAEVEATGAYNAMFDFKKAIPFTELYINKLYSIDFYSWETEQTKIAEEIAQGIRCPSSRTFEPEIFRFRGTTTSLFDIWGLACRHIINNDEYKDLCLKNKWTTPSGRYFPTNAEKVFAFVTQDETFSESHTAIDDAMIESEIFSMSVLKAGKDWERGITYFPFRILGTVSEYEGG